LSYDHYYVLHHIHSNIFKKKSEDPYWRAPVGTALTLSPPNELSSAIFLICFNYQSASTSLKIGENVVRVSNSLELLGFSSGSKLFAHGTIVMLGGLRVKDSCPIVCLLA